MLLEFSVANYRSIKERVTISMVASNDDTFSQNTFPPTNPSKLSLLKSVGIYGPNASGKSNLIKALAFMENFVCNSARGQEGDPIEVTPFKLDAETVMQPSEFEVVFLLGEERYAYGFTADEEQVHEEWLTATKRKPRLLFKRSLEKGMEFGDSWKGDKEKIAQLTRSNALFLSVAAQLNHPTAKLVFDWFKYKVYTMTDLPEQREMFLTMAKLIEDEQFVEELLEWVQAADFGIDHLTVERKPSFESLDSHMSDLNKMPNELREPISTYITSLTNLLPKDIEPIPRLKTWHKSNDGSMIKFDLFEEESAGTNRFVALTVLWLNAIKNSQLLVIDELEIKLHPLMTRFLIKAIHQANSAQLIFTTHDNSLLDAKLLRRDQVWFTEKDTTSATKVYSLWDYDVRKDENFRNGYLKGRYGAIPFIGELSFD